MIEVTFRDTCSAALAALPDRLRQALSDKANALGAELSAKVQQKLSGDVLNQKSGALARSIVTTIDDSSTNISVTVASNGDVKYAAIHEFGGVIPPHEMCRTRRERWRLLSVASKLSLRASICRRSRCRNALICVLRSPRWRMKSGKD